MSHRVNELYETYFGDNKFLCPKCGQTVYKITIPLLGEIVEEISSEPIYGPVTYFKNKPNLYDPNNSEHKCLKPKIYYNEDPK